MGSVTPEFPVIGGTTSYSYVWSAGTLTNDYLSNLAPGTYTITVTDANGCTASDSKNFIDPDQLLITAVNLTGNSSCAGNGQIEIVATGGTGNLSYGIDGEIGSFATSNTFIDLFGGVYDVAVKDQHGCVVTQPETVTGPAELLITYSTVHLLCSDNGNGSIDITISGGETPYTYLWSTSATTQDINSLAPGTYTVTVTDDNSCTATASIVVISTFTSPTANAGTDVSICLGQSANLAATGGPAYTWSSGATTANTTVTPTTTTIYTVTVTDANTCTDTDAVTVTVNSLPSATITPSGPLSFCDGGSVTLSAPGGMTSYLWTGGATSQTINASATGTYTVTVTNSNNCTNNSNVSVTEYSVPPVTITPPSPVFCDGTSQILTATSATSYLWNTGATTQTISISTAATFTVTITDVNGCSNSTATTSTVNPIPTANAGTDPNICLLGSATLTATGGGTYLWSTSQTSAGISVNPLTTTVYTVTVTDVNGCTDDDNVTVNVTQSCCGDPTNNIISSAGAIPSTTYTGNYNLNFNADVSANVTFDAIDLLIASGVSITITSGGHLTITNGSALHACGDMWQGITIEDGGLLTIDDGSTIEDAETGTDALPGSQFNIDGAIFQRNFIGIHATDGDFSSSSIENTIFGCLNLAGTAQAYSLKEPHASPAERSRFHIHLENVSNLTIGSVGNENDFAGADNGVFGRFSNNITLDHNIFHDFTVNTNSALTKSGFAARFEGFDPISLPQDASLRVIGGLIIFDTNEFTDCETGIAVYNEGFIADGNIMTDVPFAVIGQWPNNLTHVDITNNVITGTQIGVDMRAIGWTNVKIEGNTISVIAAPMNQIAVGIRVVEPLSAPRSTLGNLLIQNSNTINSLGTHGILLQNIQKARVSGNFVNMNHVSASIPVYGIRVENGKQNIVCNNDVIGDDISHLTLKTAISVVESPRTAVECNETDNTATSIEFNNTCPDSRIRANTMNNHDYGIVLSNLGVIGPQTDFGDGTTYPGNEYVGDGSYNFNTAALGSFDSDAGIASFWIGTGNPYIPIGNINSGISSSPFAPLPVVGYDPYSCPACNTVIFPELIEMDFADKIAGDSMVFDSNEDLMKWKLKYSLFEQLARDTSSTTLLHFENFMDSVSATNLMEFYSTSELINLFNDSTYFTDSTSVHTILDAAISVNDGITSSLDFESYLQYVNSIYFILVSNYNYQLSNEEYELVINIANRCPYEDGPAVYYARAILSMQGDKYYYNDSDLCAEVSRINNGIQQPLDQLLLYPVPARNELHINAGKDIIESIEIFNHLGQVINNSIYDKNIGQITIPLISYAPGIYQIRVKVRSGKHYNEKFVIIK